MTPTFPAGIYYVGDLCYGLTADAWKAMPQPPEHGSCWHGTVQDYPVWIGWTAHGDGYYTDNKGYTYGVDSGTLGVLPVTACHPQKLWATTHTGLGQVHTFITPFSPTCENGLFTIGYITIDTRIEIEEEDTEPSTR